MESRTRPMRTQGELWAITSYFNPRRYRRRLANYRTFRRQLAVPLVTVEWSCDGVFELRASDADILIRRSSPDLLWQKERLLNLAVGAVPKHVERIAWLDCDVVFGRPDWWQAALQLLERVVLVQLFHGHVRAPMHVRRDTVGRAAAPGPHRRGVDDHSSRPVCVREAHFRTQEVRVTVSRHGASSGR